MKNKHEDIQKNEKPKEFQFEGLELGKSLKRLG